MFKFIDLINPWGQLVIAACMVIIAGSQLSRYGNTLSQKLRLGQAWVGLVFMAFATTLPELFTSTAAAGIEKAPNLSIGNNLGSIFFNISIIVVLDFVLKTKVIFTAASRRIIASQSLSVILILIVCFALLLEAVRPPDFVPPGIFGVSSLLIFAFVVYLLGSWRLFKYEQVSPLAAEMPSKRQLPSLRAILTGYSFLLVIILMGGLLLAHSGKRLSVEYNLEASFVGSIFLAISTSLPELYNLALGNIFGANIMNVTVIFLSDIFYRPGQLMDHAMRVRGGQIHFLTIGLILLMNDLVVFLAFAGDGSHLSRRGLSPVFTALKAKKACFGINKI
ncbi:MAG: hypothetical protein AMS15_08780 [Planctomycetes bacterium DG_23]|nr:MAG: hypothetical protein AMS15_08780 [Planctomycetes bacterium DG_23]